MPKKSEYHANCDDATSDAVPSDVTGAVAEAIAVAEACAAEERSHQASPFARLDWFAPLRRYCFADRKPLLALVRDGRARARLYLVVAGEETVEAMANWYSFSFAPVFDNCSDQDQQDRMMKRLAEQVAAHAAKVTLAPLPGEDDMARRMAKAFRKAGWVAFLESYDENHIVTLKGRDFDAYWADRPGQLRSTVKRKAKKANLDIRISTDFSPAEWADYEAVYAQSWKPEEGHPDFLRHWAERQASQGHLRMGLAYRDGQPVAAQFWTVDHGTAYIHKLAHTKESTPYSAGTLLSAELFRHVIDKDKVDLIDFGTGDDGYKRDWMETVRARYRLSAYRPFRSIAWPALIKGSARAAIAGLVGQLRRS